MTDIHTYLYPLKIQHKHVLALPNINFARACTLYYKTYRCDNRNVVKGAEKLEVPNF